MDSELKLRHWRAAMKLRLLSTRIEDRTVTLRTAREIVRFSSIIRHSTSYLDLEPSKCPTASNRRIQTSYDCCISRSTGNYINTDEKYRKLFSPSRTLLYTLHLDLPKGREYSLKEVPESVQRNPFSVIPHIYKISISDRYEEDCLNVLIVYALKNNFPKLKILKGLLKVSLFPLLEPKNANRFISCFHPKVRDSALSKGFALQFNIRKFMVSKEKPKILEYLLYHARLNGRRDIEDDNGDPINKNIGRCVLFKLYLNIGAALKYTDSPRFTKDDLLLFFAKIIGMRPRLTMSAFWKLKDLLRVERLSHILLIIVMYLDNNSEAASETLHLIWCSVPDTCITYEEFKIGLEAVFSEELMKIYRFYVRAVGESNECAEPRPLQHLCRTVLRRRLRESKIWIPDGIRRIGLPKKLQSFLNLEKVRF